MLKLKLSHLFFPCGGVNSELFSEQSLNPPLIFLFYGGRIVLYIDLCGGIFGQEGVILPDRD